MTGTFLAGTAVFLLANLAIGLVRVLRGPRSADRMLAGQLLVTTGVAILLVLGAAQRQPQLWNVALVFAVVASVATVSFVKWDALRAAGGRGGAGELDGVGGAGGHTGAGGVASASGAGDPGGAGGPAATRRPDEPQRPDRREEGA